MPNKASTESLGVDNFGDANDKPNKNDAPTFSNHRNESETQNTGVIMDNEGHELDEDGNIRDPDLRGLPLDIKKIGYMKKLKTNKRKFFVLRLNKLNNPDEATFSYYDSEKKFRLNTSSNTQIPKQTIMLKNCFVVNHSPDARHQFLMGLFTYDDALFTICDSAKVLHDWVSLISTLQFQTSTYLERPLQEISFIWQVSIKQSGLGLTRGIQGTYRVYLHKTTLYLDKFDPPASSTMSSSILALSIPSAASIPVAAASSQALNASQGEFGRRNYQFPLISIRRCGHMTNTFLLEFGRSSPLGQGELWMNTDDTTVAVNMHEVILAAMSNGGIVNDHSLALAQHTMQRSSAWSAHRPRSLSASTNAEMLKVAAANLLANTGRRSVGAHARGRLVVTEVVEQPGESSGDSGETITNEIEDNTPFTVSANLPSVINVIDPATSTTPTGQSEETDYLPTQRLSASNSSNSSPNQTNDSTCCVSCGSASAEMVIDRTTAYHHLWSTPNLHYNHESSEQFDKRSSLMHGSGAKPSEPTITEEIFATNSAKNKVEVEDIGDYCPMDPVTQEVGDREDTEGTEPVEDYLLMNPKDNLKSTPPTNKKFEGHADRGYPMNMTARIDDMSTADYSVINEDEDNYMPDSGYTMMSPQLGIINTTDSSTSIKSIDAKNFDKLEDKATTTPSASSSSSIDDNAKNFFEGFTRAYSTGTKPEPLAPSLGAQYVLNKEETTQAPNTCATSTGTTTTSGMMGRIRAFSTGSHNRFTLSSFRLKSRNQKASTSAAVSASSPETLPLSSSTESKFSLNSNESIVFETKKDVKASSTPILTQAKVGHRVRSITLGSRPTASAHQQDNNIGRASLTASKSTSNVEEEEGYMMEIDYSKNPGKLSSVMENVDEDETPDNERAKLNNSLKAEANLKREHSKNNPQTMSKPSTRYSDVEKLATSLNRHLSLKEYSRKNDTASTKDEEERYCKVDFPNANNVKVSTTSSATFYSTVITSGVPPALPPRSALELARQQQQLQNHNHHNHHHHHHHHHQQHAPKANAVPFGPELPPEHRLRNTFYHPSPVRVSYQPVQSQSISKPFADVVAQPKHAEKSDIPVKVESEDESSETTPTESTEELLANPEDEPRELTKVDLISAKLMDEETSPYVEMTPETSKESSTTTTTATPSVSSTKKSRSMRLLLFLSKASTDEHTAHGGDLKSTNKKSAGFGNRFLSLHKSHSHKGGDGSRDKTKKKSKSESTAEAGGNYPGERPTASPISSSSSMESIPTVGAAVSSPLTSPSYV